MSVDTPEQLAGLRRAGRLVAATLRALQSAVVPGITTGELDQIAADFFAAHGARSGPILTYGYPGSICISVDEQVVHGVPGGRTLREGALVTFDVAAELDGHHADALDHGADRICRRPSAAPDGCHSRGAISRHACGSAGNDTA